MANKSFTIDYILNNGGSPSARSVVDKFYPKTVAQLSYPHPIRWQDVQPHSVGYLMADPSKFYLNNDWSIPTTAALWFHHQQQLHHHHSLPVDLSVTSTGTFGHQPTTLTTPTSLFSNNNSTPSSTATPLSEYWTTGSASPELLPYTHQQQALSTPNNTRQFFFGPSSEAAIRLAGTRRHLSSVLQPTRKGGQIRFTHRQSHHLEETFTTTRYLTPGQRRSLAIRLALTERQVKTWFQNRRAKWRRTRKGHKLLSGDSKAIEKIGHFENDNDEDDEEEHDAESDNEEMESHVSSIHYHQKNSQ